jgi:hypothetical protein
LRLVPGAASAEVAHQCERSTQCFIVQETSPFEECSTKLRRRVAIVQPLHLLAFRNGRGYHTPAK